MIIVPSSKTPQLVSLYSTTGLDSKAKIKERIAEIVKLYGSMSGACPLRDFNRRFGRALRKAGTTTSDLAVEMANEGSVVLKSVENRVWLLCPSLSHLAEMLADEEKPAMQIEHEMGMQWIERASCKENLLGS